MSKDKIQLMKLYYSEMDGKFFYFKKGRLWGCPVFIDGTPEFCLEMYVEEFDELLEQDNLLHIISKLVE